MFAEGHRCLDRRYRPSQRAFGRPGVRCPRSPGQLAQCGSALPVGCGAGFCGIGVPSAEVPAITVACTVLAGSRSGDSFTARSQSCRSTRPVAYRVGVFSKIRFTCVFQANSWSGLNKLRRRTGTSRLPPAGARAARPNPFRVALSLEQIRLNASWAFGIVDPTAKLDAVLKPRAVPGGH